jgi:2-keto-4-pentenoate hydratase
MASDRIGLLATFLVDARVTRTLMEALPGGLDAADESEGYAVQEELHRMAEAAGMGAVAGYKIGATAKFMQERLGVDHPVYGRILAPTVVEGDAVLRHGDYVNPGIEAEIVVRMGRTLPLSGAPYDRESVADAVGSAHAGFELVDIRYADARPEMIPNRIADDFSAAGAVLGGTTELDPRKLDTVHTRLLVNGEEIGSGTGDMVLGHPLEALAWLANALAERGFELNAGEIVSLGAVVPAQMMAQGDEAVAIHEPLGEARVRYM